MFKNKPSKKVLFIMFTLLLSVFLAIGIYAVVQTQTSFVSQPNPFNLNLTAFTNNTQYIDIPLYTYVQNITIQVKSIT